MADPTLPDDDEGARAMLRELAGQPPRNPHLDSGPWDFLARLPVGRVRPLVDELVGDGDAQVATRAVDVLMNLPADGGSIGRLMARAGKTGGGGDATLRERLQHALANFASESGDEGAVAAAIRKLAGSALPSAAAASVLAVHEPDYTADCVRRFAGSGGHPAFCASAAAMFAGYHRDRLLALLGDMRALPTAARQQVMSQIGSFLGLPDASVATLVARAGVPSPRTRPSLDDCRHALGL